MTAQIIADFTCPISLDIMIEPVQAADGFTYERSFIEKWLIHENTSPKTGEILSSKNLISNKTLKCAIMSWQKYQNNDVVHVSSEPLIRGIKYNSGSHYIGEVIHKDNKYVRHGHGEMKYADGTKYVGNFKDDSTDGHSIVMFSNGNKFVGNFKNRANGHGIMTYMNGDKQEGNYKDGKMHGHGVFTYVNGDKYEGNFEHGLFNGDGIMTYANGNQFEGNFVNGKRHGFGKKIYENGNICNCLWFNDKKCWKIINKILMV